MVYPGKSTLMNVITRRNINGLTITGRVAVNGVEIKEDISKLSAYIQQNDVFVGAMTVREHLMFHAKLKLSKESKSWQEDRIEEVAKIMGRVTHGEIFDYLTATTNGHRKNNFKTKKIIGKTIFTDELSGDF